jgi:dolichol-phosphate mannosyltransferase
MDAGTSSSGVDVSVVLPIYRTAAFLEELHARLTAALDADGRSFELVMVDDGSPDGAWTILRDLAGRDPRVCALRLSRNFGQHPAIAAGFEHARGERIVLMDADLQDRPEDIPRLLAALEGDVDVVYTVKQGEQEPLLTRLTSKLYHYAFSRITGARVPRSVGTFRAFTRPFLEAIRSYPEHNVLFGPLMFHIGFGSATIEVPHVPRKDGKSAYTFRKRLALAVSSLLAYTDLPHRFLVSFGGLILTSSGLYAVALLVRYIVSRGALPQGLTLLALLVTISIGSTMMALGVVGTYVFRVYSEVLRRPRYVIARRLNG